MSDLSEFIDEFCEGFDVCIDPLNGEIFIEITELSTSNFHNINVSLGQELPGLIMLMADWEYILQGNNISYTYH